MKDDAALQAALKALAAAPDLPVPERLRAPVPGERLGRFEIVRELGRGGFGVVYEARDEELGRRVALKLLRKLPLGPRRAAAVAGLKREAEAAARLNHPNVVTLHDLAADADPPYLVMELLEGESLQARLERAPLAVGEAIELALQACRGIAHAHANGVVHRDLKPANAFLCSDGRVKLLDFGLAHASWADDDRRGAGTPAFMAPEQRRGELPTERTDVYGLGALLWAMVAGRPPPLAAELSALPAGLRALLERTLADDPAARPPTAVALLDDLLALQRAHSSGADASAAPYRWLEPFGAEHAACFFGRDREVARLVAVLDARPLAAVVGPSGAGKSSLVQAGLLPALRRRGRWDAVVVRPGARPLEALRERLREAGAPLSDHALAERPHACGEALRALCRRTGGRALLFVDQLEELAAQSALPSERRAFARALLSAADERDAPVRVVVALRDDFLSRAVDDAALRDALAQGMLLLGPPDREGLLEAARGPAQAAGYALEPNLAEQIVEELHREAAPLPLLQLALSRLWEERDEAHRVLPAAALGKLGGLQGLLGAHASAVLRALGGQRELDEARRILLALVTPLGTRRQVPADEVAKDEHARATLAHLVRGRLVTTLRGEHGDAVELAHESLIEGWGELRRWVQGARAELRKRDAVAQAAQLWRSGDGKSDLLWGGDRLERARELLSQAPDLFGPPERAFLGESEARVQRSRRRQRALLMSVGAVLAVLVVALSLYARASQKAERRTRVHALVQAALSAQDPSLGPLLLAELAGEPEPEGGLTAAYAVASEPLPRAILRGHSAAIAALAFSPDGSTIATASLDGTARLAAADGRRPALVLTGHEAGLIGLAFSPDGQLVATASSDATARVFDAHTGAAKLVVRHPAGVWAVAFSADGRSLVSASAGSDVRVTPLDGRPPLQLVGHERLVRFAAALPEGRVLSAGLDRTARVWSAAGKELARVTLRIEDNPRGETLAVAPDGSQAAFLLPDAGLRLWPLAGGAPVDLLVAVQSLVTVAFAPDGKSLIAASADGTTWVIDDEGRVLAELHHPAGSLGAALSADGSFALVVTADGTARVSSVADARPPLVLRGPPGPALAAFSPDGRSVALANLDGAVRVFSLAPADALVRPLALGKSDGALALSADAARAVVTLPGRSLLIDTRTGAELLKLPALNDAALSPDGKWLLAVRADRVAELWPLDKPGPPRPIGATNILRGNFSADSARFVLQPWRGATHLGQVIAPDRLVALPPAEARKWLALDGKLQLASEGLGDGRVRVFQDGRELLAVRASPSGTRFVAHFSPDSQRLVTAGADRVLRLWSLPSGAPLGELRGHEHTIADAHFLADGRVASASLDGTVRVWDGERATLELRAQSGGVLKLAVAERAEALAFADDSGLVRMARLVGWQDALAFLRAGTTACLTAGQRATWLGESEADAKARSARCERAFGR